MTTSPDRPTEGGTNQTPRRNSQRLLLLIGSIGPLGYAPASGTVAVAVAGIPLYWLLSHLPPSCYLAFVALFALVSMWIHHTGDRILGETDSRRLVWDELAGFFVAMFALEWNWKLVVIGFFVERAIDIAKVPPANIIDRRWHTGVGVVLDDLVAGIYTCAGLHLLLHFAPSWVS